MRAFTFSNPAVELELEVELVGERPAGLEVGLEVALQALDDTLRLRVGRGAEEPVDLQLAAERGERLARATVVGVDARLAIPNEQLGQRAERPEAAADAEEEVLGLLREDQGASASARVAEAGDDDEALAGLTVADRDRTGWLPEVELAELARAVDRALVSARSQMKRPHLAQVVVDDRLRALEADRLELLADDDARQFRILAEQAIDLVLERVELRALRRPLVARRLIALRGTPDRLAVEARAAVDLVNRQPSHEAQPPHLRPLLHSDHLGPPRLALR